MTFEKINKREADSMENNDLDKIKSIFSDEKLGAPQKITEFDSGQINRVYGIDDTYVIKFQGDIISPPQNLFKHVVEVTDSLRKKGSLVPEIIASGNSDGTNYILMNKVPGRILAREWLSMDDSQRESVIAQLADQLRIFHSVSFDDYTIQTFKGIHFDSFEDALITDIDFDRIDIKMLNVPEQNIVEYLKGFYEKHHGLLKESAPPVFVHNDIHFENIFVKDNQISGVLDFDFSCQAPKDYELMLFVNFLYIPSDYVEQSLEKQYLGYDGSHDIKWMKKYYPELFEVEDLANRIRLYLIASVLESLKEYQDGQLSNDALKNVHKKVDDLFRGDWLDVFLA